MGVLPHSKGEGGVNLAWGYVLPQGTPMTIKKGGKNGKLTQKKTIFSFSIFFLNYKETMKIIKKIWPDRWE